ncbi:MAG: hypothetical protein ABW069_17040 [Duganella sp.]
MNITFEPAALLPACLALAAGVVSAVLYGRRRQWFDALLILAAALSLAVVLAGSLADVRLPAPPSRALVIDTGAQGEVTQAELQAITDASAIILGGDGLRAAQWRDLPARPLQWTPSKEEALWLDFPRTMSLGRIFTLTVRLPQPRAGWRVQLLAENRQVLADSATAAGADKKPAAQHSVQWLPPVAEAMVLSARVLDAAGKVIAQGPVPVQVTDPAPLQIVGRFNAPSFDARALNDLLTGGGAILDWQVTLGKAIARSETARAPLTRPNAIVVDAAYVEQLAPAARAALLAQAGQGVPLVVLGGNAANAALWQREFGLRLQPQSPTTEKEDQRQFSMGGVPLTMPPAALNPAPASQEAWAVAARDDQRRPWLWQRQYRQGRVIWIGVADWHRYAIGAPQALALWWQGALDAIALADERKAGWQLPDPMPVPGLRSEICAWGVKAGAVARIDGMDDVRLQARSDKADSVCAALWPRQAGWLKLRSAGVTEPGLQYIYAQDGWPAWQRGLRREATAVYAARAVKASGSAAHGDAPGRPAPVAPFAIFLALCMLALWRREQNGERAELPFGVGPERSDTGIAG